MFRSGAIGFNYYIKDHLGNARIVFNEAGAILQKTDYYPFGLEIDRNKPAVSQAVRNNTNRYLYNGKELQVRTGYVDYGARMYLPEIGRWMAVDPLSESMNSWSPYNYTFNNPLKFTDKDGTVPDITIQGANNSSVTVKTDLVDLKVNASSLGIDFGGNYSFSGKEVLQAAVDIGGVVDPTPTLDIIGAGLSAESGDYWGAGASILGASIPYVGDIAKTGKVAKGVEAISEAINLSKAEQRAAKLSKAERPGLDFTKAGKEATKDVNKAKNAGEMKCEGCNTTVQNATQHKKGQTPPSNEAHVDHQVAKSKGGSGTPDNGQVLCRDCNIKKGAN